MKKFVLLLICIVALLVSFSCSDSEKSSSITDLDFSDENWNDNYDVQFSFQTNYRSAAISLASKDSVYQCELFVNGIELPTDEWNDLTDHQFEPYDWTCHIFLLDYLDDIDISEGSNIDVLLTINGESYKNSLIIPYPIESWEFPDFEIDKNYNFNWTISNESTFLGVLYVLCFFNNFEYYDYEILKNTQKSFTISKSVYKDMLDAGAGTFSSFEVRFFNNNYKVDKDCLFSTEIEHRYYKENEWDK